MDIIQKISKTVCLLFLAILSACSENTLYIEGNGNNGGGDNSAATIETDVKGYFTLGGKRYESVASVETFTQSATPQKSEFATKLLCSAVPQIIAGENGNGEITFLYRGKPKGETTIEVNEYTTATALLTIQPTFWCLSPNEYSDLESTIKSLAGYESLVSEVRKVLESGKSLTDEANTDMFAAMNTCYKQFKDLYSSKISNKAMATKGNSKVTVADNYDYFPIEFSPEARTMAIREIGLAPPYECSQYVDGEVKASKFILPNTTYGLSDLGKLIVNGLYIGDFAEAYRDMNRGEWVEFDMTSPIDYDFKLNRKTFTAQTAQAVYYATDVLNLVGMIADITIKDNKVGLEAPLLTAEETKQIIDDVTSLVKTSFDPGNVIDGKWEESVYYLFLDFAYRHLSNSENNPLKNKEFFKAITKFCNIYDRAAAIASVGGRFYLDLVSPDSIEQCFSQHNSVITTCNGTGISVKSGNHQMVESGRKLNEPIVFSVICNLGQRVKVEVTKGNGTLSRYYLSPKLFDGTTEYVSTEWTLDDQNQEQTLKAYIVDTETDMKQSPECIVTAFLSKGNLLTSIGNTYLFTYDDKGRIETITDRTCMLVEPDPTEITKSTYIYKDDNSRELKMIVTQGDGETDKWYNIRYNSDGTMKSFRWSGTDEDGTEYGSGEFTYDSDGHIKTIVSHAEDGNVYLNFKWENGNLTEFIYSDPNAEYEEDKTDNVFISYGMQKNVHKQYPLAMVALDLGTIFFSGQIGHGPDHLPIQVGSIEQAVNTEYTLREDGYIKNERVSYVEYPLAVFNFAYNYTQNSGARIAPRQTAPRRQQQAVGARKFKHFRMLGLRRR